MKKEGPYKGLLALTQAARLLTGGSTGVVTNTLDTVNNLWPLGLWEDQARNTLIKTEGVKKNRN